MSAASIRAAILALAVFASGCASAPPTPWEAVLDRRLATFGHRNIVAIVDSAYPDQARESVATVATGAHQLDVVRRALAEIAARPQVRARVWLDRELDYVADADAPGIGAYRDELYTTLAGLPVEFVAHEDLIAKLDKAAAAFDVLVLKTDLALPYTSVFISLECGYWSDEAERRLRDAMRELR